MGGGGEKFEDPECILLYMLKAYIVHLHKTTFRGNCVKQHEKSYA